MTYPNKELEKYSIADGVFFIDIDGVDTSVTFKPYGTTDEYLLEGVTKLKDKSFNDWLYEVAPDPRTEDKEQRENMRLEERVEMWEFRANDLLNHIHKMDTRLKALEEHK